MLSDPQVYAGTVEAAPSPSSRACCSLGRIRWGYEDVCACCNLSGSSCIDKRNYKNVSPAFWALYFKASSGLPTHRIWDKSLVASDHRILGLCSRRTFFRHKELCPVVNRGRTHNAVLEFCTWPQPGKAVIGLVHLGICSLGARNTV